MASIANDSGSAPSTEMLASMMGGQAGQSGQSDPQQQVTAIIGKLRQLDQQAQQLGAELPSLQQEAQQIRQLIKKMVQKAGQGQPSETQSSRALPTGGGQ